MIVKICGITRSEDARVAVEAGATAIGFVFWPDSPRFVDPFRARAIAASLPPFVTTVGVFVDQPAAYVSDVASLVPLAAVQLHGRETPEMAAAIGRPVIKAVTLADGDLDRWPSRVMLLLDVHDPVKRGGTGRTIDWTAAAAVAAARPVLLAGGLTPENIGEAIARVRPRGVDVSSGVEQAPGIKSHERVRALLRSIHAVDASHHPARS